MTRRVFVFSGAIWLSLLPLTDIGAEEIVAERAAYHMTTLIFLDSRKELERTLQDSGLAQSDIDKTVETVINDYAKCTVEALLTNSSRESDIFLNALSNGHSVSEFDDAMADDDENSEDRFFARLAEIINLCVLAVDQENGIIRHE